MEKLQLTDEHKKIIEDTYREFLAVGLSTEPADFDAAETAIASMYERIGKKRPHFVRLSSPLGAELYINLLCKTWPAIAKSKQLGDQLWDQLWDQLRDQLGGQLGGQLRGQLWDQIWDQLGGQLGGQLRGQIWDQLGGQRLRYFGTWGCGSWDYLWAWLEGGRRVGADYGDKADALAEQVTVMRSIGWWYPFDEFCILTDRPSSIHLDEAGRLHAETGAALSYRDGYALHSWHGTRVPAHWIEQKDDLDPAEVLRAENVEQRAAGASIVGWPRMAEKLNRRIIDGDPETDIGALIELTLPGLPEPGRFLQAICPRNGTICEGVPRVSDIDGKPINTVIAAQAWRDGLPVSEYQHPLLRT